ncbi:hypothetical protein BH11ACT4_BH11ACT4_13120 [soil metagenome]
MLFRMMTTNPGISREGESALREPPSTTAALAMAMLAYKIGTRVHRRDLASVVLNVNAHQTVDDLLRQPANVSALSTAVSWLRNNTPDGAHRVPKRLMIGGETFYQLQGTQDEVDAWVMLEFRAHAEKAIKSGDYTSALAASRDGLALWQGPLLHRFYENSADGQHLRARLNTCHEDLFQLYADAVLARGGDLTDSIRHLEQALSESPEAGTSITYNLIRVLRADGRDVEAQRYSISLNDSAPEEWKERIAQLHHDESPVFQPADDSLMRSMIPSIQIRVAQIDTANHSQKTLMGLLQKTKIHPDFRLFVISGVSAAGKDSLVASAAEKLMLAQTPAMLTKYTTRSGRPNEAGYSRSLSEEEFVDKVEAGEMAFVYEKRKKLYGFDLPQLEKAMSDGTKVIAIFTEFGQVPEVRRILTTHGAAVVPILINADLDTTMRRTRMRPFSQDEKQERVESIIEDIQRMSGRSIPEEYVVIQHSNDTAFDTALGQLVEVLNGTHRGAESFLKTAK